MVFWILFVLVIVSCVSLFALLGLWVYADAKQRGEKPITWTLISLFTPNFFGLLIYLLIGRKDKIEGFKNKFKVPFVTMIVVFVITVIGFVSYVVVSNNIPIINGASIGMVENNVGDQWNISFKTSGEDLKREINLNEEQMDNFYITANCKEGNLYLFVIQGKIVKSINISDYDGKFDFDNFKDGKVKLLVSNDKARNASIKMNWD